jgi:hypothetical protein
MIGHQLYPLFGIPYIVNFFVLPCEALWKQCIIFPYVVNFYLVNKPAVGVRYFDLAEFVPYLSAIMV